MSTIQQVLAVPGWGGADVEDHTALQQDPLPPAERYTAPPRTPGFHRVREPAEALSIGLVLDSGELVWGDCVSVAYGGKAGRAPVFRARRGEETVSSVVAPELVGLEVENFRENCRLIDGLQETVTVERPLLEEGLDGEITRRQLFQSAAQLFQDQPRVQRETITQPLHPALRYGLSQALLRAASRSHDLHPCQVLCREWDLPLPDRPVPLHAQCGRDRFGGPDQMIARRISSLPHGLVDDISEQVGEDALHLIRYTRWLKNRIDALTGGRSAGYQPTIHLDLHGALGTLYDGDLGRILGTLYALEKAADPYPLRVECPLLSDTREGQIETYQTLREYLDFRKMNVQLVADEWANTRDDIQAFVDHRAAHMIQIKTPDVGSLAQTMDAVLACRQAGLEAFLGGSCAETDLSARASVHVALASQPQLLLAKPGLGISEAIAITRNEINRTLAELHHLPVDPGSEQPGRAG